MSTAPYKVTDDPTIMTTGDVARLLGISPHTIAKWFHNGMLKGSLIPGSKHRRFQRGDVIAFAEKYGIPLSGR